MSPIKTPDATSIKLATRAPIETERTKLKQHGLNTFDQKKLIMIWLE